MSVRKLLRLWRDGTGVIPSALFCSLLTCIASTASNVAFALASQPPVGRNFIGRLLTGYLAAALVVIVIFPVLPPVFRAADDLRRGLLSRRDRRRLSPP